MYSLFKRFCPLNCTSSIMYTKSSCPAELHPGQCPLPLLTPPRRHHRNCVLLGSHNDCTLLTRRSPPEQEPGMQNPPQPRGQSHTMKNCPTQNTSSTAVKKLTALWNRIEIYYSITSHVLPKIHYKNPKIHPNTINFIPL